MDIINNNNAQRARLRPAGIVARAVDPESTADPEERTVTDFPNDLGELDWRIGFDMVDRAMAATTEAERYAAERAAHIAEHGEADPESFLPWSEVSEPGTVEYGPYTPPPTPTDE
jgi:hypothetical protein